MKRIVFVVMMLYASTHGFAQVDIPNAPSAGPLGSGSWLRFLTGGGNTTSIQENWGLNITGTNLQPVKIINTSLMVGYTSSAQDFGQNNLFVNGKVGIGTTSPQAQFQVNGTTLLAGNSSNLDPSMPTNNLTFLANSAQMMIGWNRTAGAGEADFIANQGGGNTGGFAFYNHDNNNNETQLMWILGNGQVLIGNTQGKQGNYMLAVAGSAIATSVTVKTVNNWPDYVFKPKYNLASLTNAD